MRKPFEIPYNFDTKLIDFLEIYQNNITLHCIYLPPYKKHYRCAKYYHSGNAGISVEDSCPETLELYEMHIKYINSKFPGKIMLLLQQNNIMMQEDLLKYYFLLGINKFCVGSLEQAKIIKNLFPDENIEIIGSITMKINKAKLTKEYEKYFDGFVLWFPFNRDIKRIKELPSNFKYILLINCKCCTFCDGTHHWLAPSKEAEHNLYCPRSILDGSDISKVFKDLIFIRPNDLYLFDNYISYYKLQGREYTTDLIISDIIYYTTNYKYYLIDEKFDDINDIYNNK